MCIHAQTTSCLCAYTLNLYHVSCLCAYTLNLYHVYRCHVYVHTHSISLIYVHTHAISIIYVRTHSISIMYVDTHSISSVTYAKSASHQTFTIHIEALLVANKEHVVYWCMSHVSHLCIHESCLLYILIQPPIKLLPYT